jgi:hypothetical protein
MSEEANRQWRGRWLTVALGLVLAAILSLVLACGGDDEGNGGEDGEPSATESNGDQTPEATEEDGGDEGSDAASDLSVLAAEYGDFVGFVKYETSGFADDSFTTLTIYRGEGRSRVDYEGSEGSGSFITNEDGSFGCAENQCVKVSEALGLDPTAAFTALISPENIEDSFGDVPEGVDVEESSEEIAGIDATCYTYSGDLDETAAGDESGEVCFAESGLLLRFDFSGSPGGGKFEAAEADEGVSDDDFDPPYPVTDLGGFGQ